MDTSIYVWNRDTNGVTRWPGRLRRRLRERARRQRGFARPCPHTPKGADRRPSTFASPPPRRAFRRRNDGGAVVTGFETLSVFHRSGGTGHDAVRVYRRYRSVTRRDLGNLTVDGSFLNIARSTSSWTTVRDHRSMEARRNSTAVRSAARELRAFEP